MSERESRGRTCKQLQPRGLCGQRGMGCVYGTSHHFRLFVHDLNAVLITSVQNVDKGSAMSLRLEMAVED